MRLIQEICSAPNGRASYILTNDGDNNEMNIIPPAMGGMTLEIRFAGEA